MFFVLSVKLITGFSDEKIDEESRMRGERCKERYKREGHTCIKLRKCIDVQANSRK